MAIPLAVMAGASVLGGLMGKKGAKKAAEAQRQAYDAAMGATSQGYETADNLLMPRAGQESAAMDRVNRLLGLNGEAPDYSLFRDTPGYQFQQDEARQQVERSASARGGLASGNTMAALLERSQGIADTTFQNYLAQVMGLQNQGVDAARAGLSVDRGTAMSNLLLGQGGARASGIVGETNAMTGAINRIGGMFGSGGFGGKPAASGYSTSGTWGSGSPRIAIPGQNWTGPGGWKN